MIARLRGKAVASTPEGFILDVLRYYTPVNSYYRLISTTEEDPEFDTKRAKKKLRRAIVRGDAVRFQAIPGIGKKSAERIVLELKEKLAVAALAPVGGADVDDHVVARNALVELGYSIADAERALAETDAEASPEERVRQALRRAA